MIYLIICILILILPISMLGVSWKDIFGAIISNKSNEVIKSTYGIHPNSAKFIIVITALIFIAIGIRFTYRYISKIEPELKNKKNDDDKKDKE